MYCAKTNTQIKIHQNICNLKNDTQLLKVIYILEYQHLSCLVTARRYNEKPQGSINKAASTVLHKDYKTNPLGFLFRKPRCIQAALLSACVTTQSEHEGIE